MPLFEQIVSDAHLQAIATTLFHSLWQGIVVAALAGVVLLTTRKSSSALRYNLFVGLLILFVGGCVSTYVLSLSGSSAAHTAQASSSPQENITDNVTNTSSSVGEQMILFFNDNAPTIVLIWLAMVLVRIGLLMNNYYRSRRLFAKDLIAPADDWQKKVDQLKAELRVNVPVRIMESARATVPAVIGHLRPLILVPVGMLMALPAAEAEAILLHELAHIKRRDYLHNLLQQTVECIFFFHPAVRWLCALIEEEREHCCDDIASRKHGSQRIYINALVGFYEKTLNASTLTAFAGRSGSVKHRIQRLIYHRNKTLNNMEKIFLTVGLVIAIVLVYAFNDRPDLPQHTTMHSAKDTVPSGKRQMITTENGKKYRIVYGQNGVTELYIDDEKIPAEKHGEHKAVIQRLQQQEQQAIRNAGKARKNSEQALQDAQQSLERSKRDLEQSSRNRENLKEMGLSPQELQNIAANALKEAEHAIRDIDLTELKSGEVRHEIQRALQEVNEKMQAARQEFRAIEQGTTKEQKLQFEGHEDEFVALSKEVAELAMKAAHLGLKEANAELHAISEEADEKMDRKTYREKKKQLREEYRNDQRN